MKFPSWKISILLLALIFIAAAIVYINMPNEKKLFQSVIENKSLNEANKFFEKYPKSNHKDKLEKLIRNWVFEENDLELYRLALSILPQDSLYRDEINLVYISKKISDQE